MRLMANQKGKWSFWLQFLTVFVICLFGVNSKRPCGRLLRNIKLPALTRFASIQRRVNHATLVCEKGYFFSMGRNTKYLPCKKLGSFSNDQVPKCKGCGVPAGLKNGTVEFRATSVGSVAVYSCDVGLSLTTSRKQRKCRRNLRWSARKTHISCQKNKCRDPGNIMLRNGNVTFSDKLFEEFSTISFKCNDDYELHGDEDIVCMDRKWSLKRLPFCRRKRCPKPDAPENGRIYGSKYFIGSSVKFFCNSGFTLYGSRTRTCQEDKTWNGTVAVCDDGESHCRNPGSPISALKSGKTYNEGDIVYYTCKSGLKLLQGSNHRTCLKNKTWSGTPPKCVDKNYKVFAPGNETARRFQENFINSLLQTTCSGRNISCPQPDTRARALPRKYRGGLDLIFVLDTSSSITKKNFVITIDFVKAIVRIFGVDSRKNGDGTHIACVTYGTEAKSQFVFNQYSVETLERALKTIGQIKYTRGATATTVALEMVRKVTLPVSRNESTKALFLVTDGRSNVGGSPEQEADKLRKKGVEIFVVGVGPDADRESLLRLASKVENLFEIKSYDELDTLKKKILDQFTEDYSECGVSQFKPYDARARIVGGKEPDGEYWPWALKVIVGFVEGERFCGGTLINKEYVLTAAHCFDPSAARPYKKVGFGDVQVQFPYDDFDVQTGKVHVHEDYNSALLINDIALIKLHEPKRFTGTRQAICLPREINSTRIIQDGNKMFAIGWGETKKQKPKKRGYRGNKSRKLKQVKLPFKDDKVCGDNIKKKIAQGKTNWYFNSTTQFCAGDATGRKDTCWGDSGGPAMIQAVNPENGKWRWFQVGIVSWGNGCAQRGEVAYYTRVSAYVEWIDNIINS